MSATKRPLTNAHRVDLTSLRILLAVAQTGSITQAAEQCHLALGAASTRMKELEQRLGVELLERHARGVRLTEAGQLVLDRARAIERELGRRRHRPCGQRRARGLLPRGAAGGGRRGGATGQALSRRAAKARAAGPAVSREAPSPPCRSRGC